MNWVAKDVQGAWSGALDGAYQVFAFISKWICRMHGRVRGQFADQDSLNEHYNRHGSDFGATDAYDYENKASAFLTGGLPSGALEKRRSNGDTIRYNPSTDEFGVITSGGVVRTYFKPDPLVHGYTTNLDYYNAQ